ncbi:hypothetical protein AZOA_23980 [Azoarcus sp. Aa7]|nr:hypothetical protein [Azoarcus sp. Aa7]
MAADRLASMGARVDLSLFPAAGHPIDEGLIDRVCEEMRTA